MAYTKTAWQDGITGITAARLNNLETQYEKAVQDAKNVTGNYIGTGSRVTLNLGFKPTFVIIITTADATGDYIGILAFDSPGDYGQIAFHWEDALRMGNWIDFEPTGIRIDAVYSEAGVKYNYIAFR